MSNKLFINHDITNASNDIIGEQNAQIKDVQYKPFIFQYIQLS